MIYGFFKIFFFLVKFFKKLNKNISNEIFFSKNLSKLNLFFKKKKYLPQKLSIVPEKSIIVFSNDFIEKNFIKLILLHKRNKNYHLFKKKKIWKNTEKKKTNFVNLRNLFRLADLFIFPISICSFSFFRNKKNIEYIKIIKKLYSNKPSSYFKIIRIKKDNLWNNDTRTFINKDNFCRLVLFHLLSLVCFFQNFFLLSFLIPYKKRKESKRASENLRKVMNNFIRKFLNKEEEEKSILKKKISTYTNLGKNTPTKSEKNSMEFISYKQINFFYLHGVYWTSRDLGFVIWIYKNFLLAFKIKEGMLIRLILYFSRQISTVSNFLELWKFRKEKKIYIKQINKQIKLTNFYVFVMNQDCFKEKYLIKKNFRLEHLKLSFSNKDMKAKKRFAEEAHSNLFCFIVYYFFFRIFWKSKIHSIKKNLLILFLKKEKKVEKRTNYKKNSEIHKNFSCLTDFSGKIKFIHFLNFFSKVGLVRTIGKKYFLEFKKKKIMFLWIEKNIDLNYFFLVKKTLFFLELTLGNTLNFKVIFFTLLKETGIYYFLTFFAKKTPNKIEKIFEIICHHKNFVISFNSVVKKFFQLGFIDFVRKLIQKNFFYSGGEMHLNIAKTWWRLEIMIKNTKLTNFMSLSLYNKQRNLKDEIFLSFSLLHNNHQWVDFYDQLKSLPQKAINGSFAKPFFKIWPKISNFYL